MADQREKEPAAWLGRLGSGHLVDVVRTASYVPRMTAQHTFTNLAQLQQLFGRVGEASHPSLRMASVGSTEASKWKKVIEGVAMKAE